MRINEFNPDTVAVRERTEKNIQRVKTLLDRQNLDALFVITYDNWRYITGLPIHHSLAYATVNAAILTRKASLPFLLPLDFFAGRIRIAAPWYEMVRELPFAGTPEALQPTGSDKWGAIIAETFGELGLLTGSLAIDPGTPWSIQESLRSRLPKARLCNASSLLSEARCIKNDDEIHAIRRACQIADIAIENALSEVREGVSESELAARIERDFRYNGAEYPSMMPCVFSGDHPRLGYICSSDRRIKSGELVRFDIGCAVDGYCSCIARTGYVGQPDNKLSTTYKILHEALQAGISSIRPGITNCDVHQVMDDVLRKNSKGEFALDWYGGHGIGLGLHEQPMIGREGVVTKVTLQPGMVFALEPAILLTGKGWLGLEDNVVVREGGSEVLNAARFGLT